MSFELFGMDQTTSIILILGVIWAVGIVIALIVIIVLCCRRNRRDQELDQTDEVTEASDKLIPPIFYTEHLRDPLAQEDLLERSHAKP
jgi:beta-lactamase regulating signal transducer with metallopeptidase domain